MFYAMIKLLGSAATIFTCSLFYVCAPASQASFMHPQEAEQTKVMFSYLSSVHKSGDISILNAWSVQITDLIKFEDGSSLSLQKEKYTEYPALSKGISIAVPDDIRVVFFDLLLTRDDTIVNNLLVGWKFYSNKKPGLLSSRSFFINRELKKVIYINPYSK